MLVDGDMPKAAWAEAIQTATYIRNRAASSATKTTPFEAMFGRKPTMGHIRRFGEEVVALKRGRDVNKLLPKGEVLRLCGYAPTQKGYRLVDTRTGKLTVSRNCRFLNDNNEEVIHFDHPDEPRPGTSQEPEDPEKFEDCSDRQEQLNQPREQRPRRAKVPVNYKDVSSDDEEW